MRAVAVTGSTLIDASRTSLGRGAAVGFVAVMTAASVLSFAHRFLPAVLVDALRADLRIDDVQFGYLQTAFAFAYAGATLLAGWYADRTNRRNLVCLGVAFWTVGSAVFALADGLPTLLVARAVVGLGEAVLAPAGISLLCDFVAAPRRGMAIASFYFGATLGTSLAFAGGGRMLEYATGGGFGALPLIGALAPWRQVVLLLALVGAVLLPALLAFREPARPRDFRPDARGRLQDLWSRRGTLLLVFVTGSSIAFADFAYTTWQTALLTRGFAMTPAQAGAYVGAATFAAGVAGAWLGGLAVDRAMRTGGVPARVSVIRGCAAGLIGAALLLLLATRTSAVAAYAIWQIVANVAYVAVAVTLQDVVTDRTRAIAASLQTGLSIALGLGLGPAAVAALNLSLGRGSDRLGSALLLFVGTLGVVTLVFASLLRARLRRAPAAAAELPVR